MDLVRKSATVSLCAFWLALGLNCCDVIWSLWFLSVWFVWFDAANGTLEGDDNYDNDGEILIDIDVACFFIEGVYDNA